MEREPQQAEANRSLSEKAERSFEDAYAPCVVGEVATEDGRIIRAYELVVDLSDQAERRAMLAAFVLDAAAAGYSHAIVPITMDNVGYRDQHGQRPLTAFLFVLETSEPPRAPDT
jgi:hypothetical protein